MSPPLLEAEQHTDPGVRTREIKRLVTVKKVEITTVLGILTIAGVFTGYIVNDSRANNRDTRETAIRATAETKEQVRTLETRFDATQKANGDALNEIRGAIQNVTNILLQERRARRERERSDP